MIPRETDAEPSKYFSYGLSPWTSIVPDAGYPDMSSEDRKAVSALFRGGFYLKVWKALEGWHDE